MVEKLIGISTTKYSTLFSKIFDEFSHGCRIQIDGKEYREQDIAKLKSEWCQNSKIEETRNFKFSIGDEELFGFHDSPDQLWAATSVLDFVQRLADEKIIRYQIMPVMPEKKAGHWIIILIILLILFTLFSLLFK